MQKEQKNRRKAVRDGRIVILVSSLVIVAILLYFLIRGVSKNPLEGESYCEDTGSVIEISANSFPGTYYVTGDTYARSEASGIDEFFQFIIQKAKVQSENTITLEAEGDPSVFNMNLRVMRPADGKMMKLVKYDLTGDAGETAEDVTVDLVHNHVLTPANEG